jgi:hypothetical protein
MDKERLFVYTDDVIPPMVCPECRGLAEFVDADHMTYLDGIKWYEAKYFCCGKQLRLLIYEGEE